MPFNLPAPRRRKLSDPLSAALLPPPDETPAEREQRLYEESEGKKISDNIDDQLRAEKAALIIRKRARIKVLLLGQSESGKSTTLKQFQLFTTPIAFHAERIASRSVIYLNLIRSIRHILEILTSILPYPISADATSDHPDADYLHNFQEPRVYTNSFTSENAWHPSEQAIRRFQKFVERLAPLAGLEAHLLRQISDREEDVISNFNTTSQPPSSTTVVSSNCKRSFFLGDRTKLYGLKSARVHDVEGWWEDADDPAHVLDACAGGEFGMVALWKDQEVRETLRMKRVIIEEDSGFLNDIMRITARKYIPTDEDVLKAQIKTVKVVEHSFMLKSKDKNIEWTIYDVGGTRSLRQTWAPYFDDVNAIIFLAPISAFDQVLEEDRSVNRLEDSLFLWKSLVSNRLLSKVSIILHFTKCDLLKSKLEAGVQLNRYLLSYGDRSNDYDTVSRYIKNKFSAMHRAYSPNKDREFYIHYISRGMGTHKISTIISTGTGSSVISA